MSETRKNHLSIEEGLVKDDEHVGSYKPIPESDTAHNIKMVEYIEPDNNYIPTNQTQIMEVTDDTDDHFDREKTELLLNLYMQNIHRFRNPKIKKKNLWMDIANIMGKSPDCCDKKFRNLKMTYIRLLKKKINNELTTCKWPYFDIFEEIFNVGGEYQPEIQVKIHESHAENISNVLIDATPNGDQPLENGEPSSSQKEGIKKRISKKRDAEIRRATMALFNRQKTVEQKLDRLIDIVQDSNSIQRERNRLFQVFLQKLNESH